MAAGSQRQVPQRADGEVANTRHNQMDRCGNERWRAGHGTAAAYKEVRREADRLHARRHNARRQVAATHRTTQVTLLFPKSNFALARKNTQMTRYSD